ncbi:MAG: hypothetical protein OXH02_04940 [Gemmatimonadetes bacterium]|nr:hypothetical protein [Gemmatimonadota bacterium]
MVLVVSPSSVAATKSLPLASDTDTFTVILALGAGVGVKVKVTFPPSVTAAPPDMVIVGTVCDAAGVANDANAARTAGKIRRIPANAVERRLTVSESDRTVKT